MAHNLTSHSGHIFQEGTLPQLQTAAVKAPEAPEVAEVPEVKVLEVKEVVAPKSSDIPPVTPQHAPSTSSVIVHPPSSGSTRMVTRVSSGAIRHKSVGELLGETPKSTPSRTTEAPRDPATIESLAAGFGQTITIPKTPNPPPPRTRGAIFQDPNLTTPPPSEDLDKLKAAAEIYALDHLVSKAHKSVTSADWTKGYNDKLTIAIVNRINELKEQGLWSLRQPEKQKAPSRANSHWDYLLKEMEWMSTNFYEDRKFMMKGAWVLAQAVKEYHDAEDNQSLLHKWPRRSRAPTKHLEEEAEADEDVLMVNHRGSASPISMDVDAQPQLEKPVVNGDAEQGEAMLIDEVKKESAEDEVLPTPSPSACEIEDPSAIFTLSQDSIYAPVNELPKQDGSSFPQLPIYGPPTLTDEPYSNEVDNYPIVPISKFCLQRHVVEVKNWEPRLKTYRELPREYPDEATEIGKEVQVEAIPSFAPAGGILLAPTLLMLLDVHRRRMNTIFIRPPPPPNHWTDQKTSPWTPDEERQLLQLAKDSAYNFDLVASAMAFGASSVSDTEKRSAWECFEKFRAIYPDPNNIAVVGQNKNIALSRLEKAQRLSVSQASRNKPNMIVRQPRLDVRRHRYLNLFDAMRKSAKNREKQKAQGIFLFLNMMLTKLDKPPVKKQKDNMPSKTNAPTPTPLDLAKLKAEKDRAFNQVLIAEQKSAAARATQIPQLPAGATPEMQEEYRRHLMAQQAAILTAQANANGQAIRANPGLGRGLVIPGGPNARPMPIRPNNPGLGQLSNAMANGVPIRLPDGTTAMPEQVQRIIRARQQMALASAAGGNLVPQTPQQMQRFRLLQQQVHLSQAQAGQNANANAATFAANGVAGQGILEFSPKLIV